MPTAAKIASSSVGGSRRTRRVPYFVFQSSLIKSLASSPGSDWIGTCYSRLCRGAHSSREPVAASLEDAIAPQIPKDANVALQYEIGMAIQPCIHKFSNL